MGFLPNDGLVMAHKPEVLTAVFDLARAVYAPGKIDAGLKRMIGHIASRASGCQYCSAHTAFGASGQGVSQEKLEHLWEYQTSSLFSKAEKAALELALKASMVPNQATDQDFEVLKVHYDTEAIIEIVSVISLFGFLNRWNATLNTELETKPSDFYDTIKQQKDE
mgnify:CR=1 FL=1